MCGLFMKRRAWGAMTVFGRLPWLTRGSGASKSCMLGMTRLRLIMK